MFDLEKIIEENMVWIIPILTIILSFLALIAATPDNEHLETKDYLCVGINLSISAITILITNYQSYTAVWLIIIDFVVIWIVSIIIRKFFWNRSLMFDIIGCMIFLLSDVFYAGLQLNIFMVIYKELFKAGNHLGSGTRKRIRH